jgi:hypothetical protein
MTVRLRKQTFKAMHASVSLSDLPVVFTGPLEDAEKWAAENRYDWKASKHMLFGGYWYKKVGTDGEPECLLPT